MTNNLDATVFVFRHKDGSIVAMYPDQAKAHKQNPKLEHVATLEPRAWIQAHYGMSRSMWIRCGEAWGGRLE